MITPPLTQALIRMTNRELNRIYQETGVYDFIESPELFHFSEAAISTFIGEKTKVKDISKMATDEHVDQSLRVGGLYYYIQDLGERLESFKFKHI